MSRRFQCGQYQAAGAVFFQNMVQVSGTEKFTGTLCCFMATFLGIVEIITMFLSCL